MPAPKDSIKKQIWLSNLSRSHRGKTPWNKGRRMPDSFCEKMRTLSLKFWYDPVYKQRVQERNKKVSISKIGDRNPMKRPDLRLKASIRMKERKLIGDLNPSRGAEVRAKISRALQGHTFSPEVREKIRKTLTGKLVGELNPFYGKHHTNKVKEKSRIRAINMIASGLLSNRRTTIELKIRKELMQTGFKFDEQFPLEEITVADFYLPEYGIVIYCDGDYWHKGEWAKKYNVTRKDNWQTKVLESRGYKVFRFNETEINIAPEKCINLVKTFILDNSNERYF